MCRTANGWDANGFGQLKDGRGNICPNTIILPELAMEAKEKAENNNSNIIDEFFVILEDALIDSKDQLEERFEWICSQDPASATFMWDNNCMAGYVPEEGIKSAMKHGTLAIGQLGLAECLQILIGCDHTSKEGLDLAIKIETLFRDRCKEFKAEDHSYKITINGEEKEIHYHLNYGVYYSPCEMTCKTAMDKFKAKYGVIPNVSEHKFFTNSIHVPVWKEISPFEKIDIESKLTGFSSAGCITYVEFDSAASNNLEALEQIIDYAMDHDIPYFAINVPNDTCLECGYTGEFNDKCPVCKSKHIQQLRRVTGYLTGDFTTAFNEGKQEETRLRYKHSNKLNGDIYHHEVCRNN